MKSLQRKILVSLLLALVPFILFAQNKKKTKIPEGMVLIPAGEFWMGSDEEEIYKACAGKACDEYWFVEEKPKHKVYLADYFIDKYEITNAQYKKCVEEGECRKPNTTWHDNEKYANHPVVYVDWYMADAYCKWAGKRLPTEAEWEKSARGRKGNIWPWGNTWDENKCNNWNYKGHLTSQMVNMHLSRGTTPVGSFSKCVSLYGVYDMAGNVSEWVSDWYDGNYYKSLLTKNPKGPIDGYTKVVRGGSWSYDSEPYRLRGANRYDDSPNFGRVVTGFRCAKDAE